MRTLTISTLIAAMCFATAASAQVNDPDSRPAPWAGYGRAPVSGIPWYSEGTDPVKDACNHGNRDACLTDDLGECADENPQVAISACTRELRWDQSRRQERGGRQLRAAVYAMRGSAHFKLGDLEEAIDDYHQSITLYDRYYWVYADLAQASFDNAQYEESLGAIENAILLQPDSPLLLDGRARVLATAPDEGIRNVEQAFDDVEAAISLSGDVVPLDFYDTLAAVHAANGDFDHAVEVQRRVVSLLPEENRAADSGYQDRLDSYLLQQYLRTPPSD